MTFYKSSLSGSSIADQHELKEKQVQAGWYWLVLVLHLVSRLLSDGDWTNR